HFVIFIHSLIMLLCVYDALCYISFFFNDPAPSGIYPLSLHDALPISIECIAGGILARLGKVSRDQPALVGGQMEPLPGTGRNSFRPPPSPNDPPRLAARSDDFDRFHPAPHAATPHRARPCCVGGYHAARRRERTRGWVGGEPQAERSRGRRQLGPRDGG